MSIFIAKLTSPIHTLIFNIGVCQYHSLHAKSLQSILTICNLVDYSPPPSSVHGILQARILE